MPEHEMKRVGWWHFEISVPREWDIVAQGRSESVETFSLADANYAIRLEVSLEKLPFEKARSAGELLEAYRKLWERRAEELRKRQRIEVQIRHVSKEDVTIGGHKGVLWNFRVDRSPVAAAVWYCERSERAVSLTFFPRSPEEDALFRLMLGSVKCHYETESERALWSLLVASLRLPQFLYLVAAKFAPTATYSLFSDRDSERYLLVSYSGLASFVSGRYKGGAREWFGKEVLNDASKGLRHALPKIKYVQESADELALSGESGALLARRRLLLGKLWLDRNVNRYFAALVFYPSDSAEEARALLGDVIAQLSLREI